MDKPGFFAIVGEIYRQMVDFMARTWLVISFYGVLALLAIYMPLFHLETHVPGAPTTDYYHFHWNFWWIRHAISDGLPIYETSYVFYPFNNNLAFHTLTPFWFPLWAVLEPLTGTVPAMTGIFWAAFTLNGVLFYALLDEEGVTPGLALVGGAMLALSPVMFNALYWTNINLMNWFWIPVILLVWRRIARTGAIIWALALAVTFWAMILSDLQYPLFAALIVVPYGLWTLWRAGRRWLNLTALAGVAVGGGLILLWLVGPLPAILRYDTGELVMTPAERAIAVYFPDGYLWHAPAGEGVVTFGGLLLPLVAGALILWVWRGSSLPTDRATFSPPVGFWLLLTLLPVWLAAGPQLPLLYDGLHQLFGGIFRYPERFVAVATIPDVLFAGRALTPFVGRSLGRRLGVTVGLLLALLGLGRVLHPLDLQPLPPAYDFYAMMGDEPYDYVVLEVPTGASSGEGIVGVPDYSALQFYGIAHGKRMVNGHLSRVDVTHYWYMRTDDPLFAWLGQRRFLEPDQVAPRLAQVIRDYPVGYIVIHTNLIERYTSRATVDEVIGYLNSLPDLLCPPLVEGAAVVYRTTWHPAGCQPRTPPQAEPGLYQLDLGQAGDVRYLGWGWHFAEQIVPGLTARWMGAPHATDSDATVARVYVDLPAGAYALTLNAQAFGDDRTVSITVNGQQLAEITIPAAALTPVTLSILAEVIGDGDTITLELNAPAPTTPPGSDRALSILVDAITWRQQDTSRP